jgi:hypothetical protein
MMVRRGDILYRRRGRGVKVMQSATMRELKQCPNHTMQ